MIRKAEGCTSLTALEKAAHRHPELVRKYNAEGEALAKTAVTRIATTPAEVVRFDAAVDEIMARDNVPRLVAMETVVREQPRLYEAYQIAGQTPSDQGLRSAGATAV